MIRAAAKVVDARVHTAQVATGRGAAGAAQRVVVCKYSGSEVWLRWRSRGGGGAGGGDTGCKKLNLCSHAMSTTAGECLGTVGE
jgi:hypothetical protein